jgi:membrane associated rhomboid family serine protease
MATLVAAYALQCINEVYFHTAAERHLGLTSNVFSSGSVWQLLTFQFLHGNLLHLFCNLLGLWFFGRFVEQVLGRSRFLIAYIISGIAGGLLQAILMTIFPDHFGSIAFGASAGVCGMFAIFARLESETELSVYFILPIRAKYLLIFTGALSAFFTLVPTPRQDVAYAAHLGGILAGLLWVRLGWHHDFIPTPWEAVLERLRKMQHRPPRRRPLELVRTGGKADVQLRRPSNSPQELPAAEFISKEVDPILDKISAHGLQSLTAREREVLEAARKKME